MCPTNAITTDELVRHVQVIADYQRSYHKKGFRACCELIIAHGAIFNNILDPLPKGIPIGTPKECYRNAFQLAFRRQYIYVEGYAAGIIPVPHAWCLTPPRVALSLFQSAAW